MSRYATKAYDDWYDTDRQSIDVICENDEPRDTGLLDAQGARLYRMPERHPIGFRPRRPVVRVKAGSAPAK